MTVPGATGQVIEVVDGVFDLTLTNKPARYRSFLFDWDVPTLGSRKPTEMLLSRLQSIDLCPRA